MNSKRDNEDVTAIPNTKKVINDIVKTAEIPFMNQPSKTMFNTFHFMLVNNIVVRSVHQIVVNF